MGKGDRAIPVHVHIMRSEVDGDNCLEPKCVCRICRTQITQQTSSGTPIRNHIQHRAKLARCELTTTQIHPESSRVNKGKEQEQVAQVRAEKKITPKGGQGQLTLIESPGSHAIKSIQKTGDDVQASTILGMPSHEVQRTCSQKNPRISNDVGNKQEHDIVIQKPMTRSRRLRDCH